MVSQDSGMNANDDHDHIEDDLKDGMVWIAYLDIFLPPFVVIASTHNALGLSSFSNFCHQYHFERTIIIVINW